MVVHLSNLFHSKLFNSKLGRTVTIVCGVAAIGALLWNIGPVRNKINGISKIFSDASAATKRVKAQEQACKECMEKAGLKGYVRVSPAEIKPIFLTLSDADQIHRTFDLEEKTFTKSYLGINLGSFKIKDMSPSARKKWDIIIRCYQESLNKTAPQP